MVLRISDYGKMTCPHAYEGPSKRDDSELMGRTECNRVVNFVGQPRLIGHMVDVTITDTRTYSLRGEVVTQDRPAAG